MTPTRTNPEWQVEYDECLGRLCAGSVPTREQEAIARLAADDKMLDLEIQERLDRVHGLARERRRDYAMKRGPVRNPHND